MNTVYMMLIIMTKTIRTYTDFLVNEKPSHLSKEVYVTF